VSKRKIEFTLPADLKCSSLVRRISEEIFHHVGFTKEWANRLKLVVDELFMNANRYGSKKEGGTVFIEFSYDDETITFKIEDEGVGSKKTCAKDLKQLIDRNSDEMRDVTKTSGRGLALISNLWTDSMMVEDSRHGGIAISFTKKISSEAPPAPPPIFESAKVEIESKQGQSPVTGRGTVEIIELSGEIDASNLEEKIQSVNDKLKVLPRGSTLVLDCASLVYINSTFIGYLAAWLNELQAKDGQLVLRNTNKQIRDVLELVGLSKVIYLET